MKRRPVSERVKRALRVGKHIERTLGDAPVPESCASLQLRDPSKLKAAVAQLQLDADLLLLQAVSEKGKL